MRRRFREWAADVDEAGFGALLDRGDLLLSVASLTTPILYVVAADDERIPVSLVERLHARTPRSELLLLESGGHREPSHDPRVHELTLDWLERELSTGFRRRAASPPGNRRRPKSRSV